MLSSKLNAEIESRWRAWVLAHTRRAFRLSIWLLIAFYSLFAPLDLLVTPAPLIRPYWVVRGVVLLVSFLCLRLSRSALFDRAPALVSATYFVAVPVASLTYMVALLEGPLAIYTGAICSAMLSLGVALLFVWPRRVVLVSQAAIVLPFVATHFSGAPRDLWPILVPSTFFVALAATVASIAQVLHWRSRREQVSAHAHVERLEQAQRDARQALQTQAAELERANERLRELDRLKTDLIANVSHDLRTPLTLILAAFGNLKSLVPDAARPEIDMGERNAARLLQLIDDLLELARLDSDHARVRKVSFDLAQLVRELAAAFGKGHGRALAVSGADQPLVVSGDPHMLASALSNLLANAHKFTESQDPRVEVRLTRDGDDAIIEVEDDGIGIERDQFDRIFDRFAQVEAGASRRFQGSGIGLAVVREIVDAHGGRVTLKSELGRGSTFRVELPIGAPAEADAPLGPSVLPRGLSAAVAPLPPDTDTPPPVPSLLTRLAPSALVVEDHVDMRRTLARILGAEYRVRTACDGAQGLAEAREQPPDLVVTDEMMPGKSGSELLAELREDPALRDIPVIFVTARSDPESRVRLLEAGADDLLVKPFHDGELLARARRLVEAREQARRLAQANHDLDLFASTAAHDLQAPVRTIGGFAQHLRRMLGPSLNEQALKYLEYIEDGSQRLTELIRGMLALARLASAPAPDGLVDLGEVLADVQQDLTADLQASGGDVIGAPLPVVSGDRGQLRQLVQNLVSNGLKFRRPDVPPVVRVTAVAVGGRWEVAFADNGMGFDPDQAERIFEPLIRLHGAGSFPGTGLGLAICRRIAEHHGGSIKASSTPGDGATFTVCLPATRSREEEAA